MELQKGQKVRLTDLTTAHLIALNVLADIRIGEADITCFGPNWENTGAYVILKQQGEPNIEIHIDNNNNRDRFCVLASLTGNNDHLEVRREELFFTSHQTVDKHYGFGFRWKIGSK